MKKLTYLSLAVSGFLMVSCANEDFSNPNGNGEASVAFNLSIPQIQTRAYADGTTAKTLKYAIFDVSNNDKKIVEEEASLENLKKTVIVQLVNGHTYKYVFWASSVATGQNGAESVATNPYSVTFSDNGEATLSVNYEKVTANNENLDAFYATGSLEMKGATSVNVDMKRPFAQINLVTNDYETAKKIGYKPSQSKVKVSKLYNSLDLLTGTTDGEQQEVEFGYAEIDKTGAGLITASDNNGYQYLNMVYVLANEESENIDLEYTWKEADKEAETSITVGSVPVQRNHRTNIYGSLLTNPVNINVEIKPAFEDEDNNREVIMVEEGKVKYNGTTYDTLPLAFAAARENGETEPVFYVGETTEDSPIIVNDLEFKPKTRAEGEFNSVTIKGAGFAENTVLQFNPTSVYINDSNFTFNCENVKMIRGKMSNYTESTASSFIRIGHENYKNCIIDGCVMLYVNGSATFDGCTFTNSEKSGFPGYSIYYYSYSGSEVKVENCEFNVQSKAIVLYSEAPNTYALTVNNTKFIAAQKDDKAAIQMHTEAGAISGTVRINSSTAINFDDTRNGGLWCEEKNNAQLFTPTYNFDIFIDGVKVQAKKSIMVNGEECATLKQAIEKITTQGTIELGGGNYNVKSDIGTWPENKNITFKGLGADLTGLTDFDTFTANGSTLNFEDLSIGCFVNVLNHTSMGFKDAAGVSFKNVAINGEYHTYSKGDETFENCVFNYFDQSGTNYLLWHDGIGKTTVKNCIFNADKAKAILVYSNSKATTEMSDMEITGCTFNSSTPGDKASVEIHSELFTKAGSIKIESCKFDQTNFGGGLWREIVNAANSDNGNQGDHSYFYTVVVDGETQQTGSETGKKAE